MIEIHTLGWKNDHAVLPDEDPNVSIHARVFVDGVEIPQVARVRTHHSNDFALTVITLIGAIEIVNHTGDSWEELT